MTRSRSSTTTTITSSRGNIELPKGYPSHNVVEIIFHRNWGRKPFPGQVKLIFKVQNVSRVVARFKEFLKVIKARIVARLTKGNEGKENVRCITDGNEPDVGVEDSDNVIEVVVGFKLEAALVAEVEEL
ncbi:hypothetical protein GmHk_03G006455 [Glycine max]|nr:hypothetical protein GmHk_03G006455 [Glycine max]